MPKTSKEVMIFLLLVFIMFQLPVWLMITETFEWKKRKFRKKTFFKNVLTSKIGNYMGMNPEQRSFNITRNNIDVCKWTIANPGPTEQRTTTSTTWTNQTPKCYRISGERFANSKSQNRNRMIVLQRLTILNIQMQINIPRKPLATSP